MLLPRGRVVLGCCLRRRADRELRWQPCQRQVSLLLLLLFKCVVPRKPCCHAATLLSYLLLCHARVLLRALCRAPSPYSGTRGCGRETASPSHLLALVLPALPAAPGEAGTTVPAVLVTQPKGAREAWRTGLWGSCG